ncbi:MAG: hypothetical protein IKA41_00190 [Bacteroidaceae bacterium]|nr:hypothetical protein [Bacteroidaceae bacterium]
MKKTLALLLIFASLAIVLVSCGGDSIIGTWETTEDGVTMAITFEEGGKGKITTEGITMDMTWSEKGGKLTASVSLMGMSEELFKGAEYKVDGDKLTITSEGKPVTFTKNK